MAAIFDFFFFIYFAADRHGPNSVARTCECLEGVSSREFAFLTHLLMTTVRLFSKLHFVKLQPANELLKPHPNSKHVHRHVAPCHLQTGFHLPFLVCFPFPNQKIVAFWRCSPKRNVVVSTKAKKREVVSHEQVQNWHKKAPRAADNQTFQSYKHNLYVFAAVWTAWQTGVIPRAVKTNSALTFCFN